MNVLGIESSCDETAAAIVTEDGTVLAETVASQVREHAEFGGVVPELASRAHLRNLVPVLRSTLAQVPGGLASVDSIAVTQGPGLIGCLLVGLQAAKAIAFARDLPLVGVNHLDGHLLAIYLRRGSDHRAPEMPYVALLVSGGHTGLYVVRSPRDTELLGQTRDDAAGEAFDKVAKLLELGYPGGPIVDRLAKSGDPKAVPLPIPMARSHGLEFSFSGLKTAVAQHVRKQGAPTNDTERADLCASFQHALVESLVRKAMLACHSTGIDRLVITGGVAANAGLRTCAQQRCDEEGVSLYLPAFASCTDNAAMIAYAGAQRLLAGERDELSLRAFSRDPERRRGRFARDGRHLPPSSS